MVILKAFVLSKAALNFNRSTLKALCFLVKQYLEINHNAQSLASHQKAA